MDLSYLSLQFKLHILNLVGQQLATFIPDDEPLLGVRHVAWHPSGTYLVIGGWDSKVCLLSRGLSSFTNIYQLYILSNLEWRLVATIQLNARLPSGVVRQTKSKFAVYLIDMNRNCGGSLQTG